MLDPITIQEPSDLRQAVTPPPQGDDKVQLTVPLSFGFDFHWLQEVALGVVEGDLGLSVAGGTATVDLTLGGHFRRVIRLDEEHRLRLQLFQQPDRHYNFAGHIAASVRIEAPPTETVNELAAAILGVHEAQWLADLPRIVKSCGKGDCVAGLTARALRCFLDRWKTLDLAAAAEIWKAACAAEPAVNDADFAGARRRLKDYADGSIAPSVLKQGLESLASFHRLDRWIQHHLAGFFGPISSDEDLRRLRQDLRRVLDLRDSIYRQAAAALEKKVTAELSRCYSSSWPGAPLVDCSFDFTAEGLRLYRQSLAGDYRNVPGEAQHVRIHRGTLTHDLPADVRIELHLPFLLRNVSTRLAALDTIEVHAGEDGRLMGHDTDGGDFAVQRNDYQARLLLAAGLRLGTVHSPSNFTLSFTGRRTLPSIRLGSALAPVIRACRLDQGLVPWLDRVGRSLKRCNVEASYGLSIPGALAAAWLDAPGERSPDFTRVYSRLSVAVQRAMRQWLPNFYFADLSRYENLSAALPLMVYLSSRPHYARSKMNFTYDPLRESSLEDFFDTSVYKLPVELMRTYRTLSKSGKKRIARHYAPTKAAKILTRVRKAPMRLVGLLMAEAFLVDAVVNLGCRTSRLRAEMADDPHKAIKSVLKYAGKLVHDFDTRLRRAYLGVDLVPLGSLLLVEATNALASRDGEESAIHGVLRLKATWEDACGAFERTFVTEGFRAEESDKAEAA